jgi:isoquinoline 1-oxidoreductase beta subunit
MPDKVNGGGVFGIDLSVPGMLYSSLERPPVYGAKLLSFDKAAAEQVRGVQSVVTIADGAAVVANSLEAAWKEGMAADRRFVTVALVHWAPPRWSTNSTSCHNG